MTTHRHACSTNWTTVRVVEERNIVQGLSVRLVDQEKAYYPPGDTPSCCTETRTCIEVVGVIRGRGPLEQVTATLDTFAPRIRAVVRENRKP